VIGILIETVIERGRGMRIDKGERNRNRNRNRDSYREQRIIEERRQ
jgi:hypothetical protein